MEREHTIESEKTNSLFDTLSGKVNSRDDLTSQEKEGFLEQMEQFHWNDEKIKEFIGQLDDADASQIIWMTELLRLLWTTEEWLDNITWSLENLKREVEINIREWWDKESEESWTDAEELLKDLQ